jgi:DNA-binding HxlR family transcriptional regulator
MIQNLSYSSGKVIGPRQTLILMSLLGGEKTAIDFEIEFGITRSVIHKCLLGLESRGLIKREVLSGSLVCHVWSLTKPGRKRATRSTSIKGLGVNRAIVIAGCPVTSKNKRR